ncbi:MAG: hypothetical protein ACRC9N_11155 [Aeromonas sp.]
MTDQKGHGKQTPRPFWLLWLPLQTDAAAATGQQIKTNAQDEHGKQTPRPSWLLWQALQRPAAPATGQKIKDKGARRAQQKDAAPVLAFMAGAAKTRSTCHRSKTNKPGKKRFTRLICFCIIKSYRTGSLEVCLSVGYLLPHR